MLRTLFLQAPSFDGFASDTQRLVNGDGVQIAALSYPHLSSDAIFHSMEVFYRRFYFRPAKIWQILREMLASWEMMKRRLREGVEFMRFLRAHDSASATIGSKLESAT
jgi:hypothetical protein